MLKFDTIKYRRGSLTVPRYHYDVSISRQKRFIRRFKKLLLLLLGVCIVAGIVIAIDSLRQSRQDSSEIGASITTTIRPSILEFDSPYFTFTSPSNWKKMVEETTETKFVYRSFRGQLVEQELKIYVNGTTEDMSAIRVLPVRVDETRRIIPSDISDHCQTTAGVKSAKAPIPVTINQTNILCQVDGTNFLVVVGEKGGDTSLRLKRPDGSTATYSFLYRSSSVPADTTDLVDILNSFSAQ